MNISVTSEQVTKILNENFNLYFSFFLLAFPLFLIYELPKETFGELSTTATIAIGLTVNFFRYFGMAILFTGWVHVIAHKQKPKLQNLINLQTLYTAMLMWLAVTLMFLPSAFLEKSIFPLSGTGAYVALVMLIYPYMSILFYVFAVYLVFRASPLLLLVMTKQKASLAKAFEISRGREASIIWGFFHAAKIYAVVWMAYNLLKGPIFVNLLSSENETANFVITEIFKLPLTTFLTPLIVSFFFISLTIHYKEYLRNQS